MTLADQQTTADFFVTVGADGNIRIWNFSQKHMGFALNIEVERVKMARDENGALTRLCAIDIAQKWRD